MSVINERQDKLGTQNNKERISKMDVLKTALRFFHAVVPINNALTYLKLLSREYNIFRYLIG
jgi:hypothetical protein